MNQLPEDEILLTGDILSRYKISRSTLYFGAPRKGCRHRLKPHFPSQRFGSPKRWKKSVILKWEKEVNAEPADALSHTLNV